MIITSKLFMSKNSELNFIKWETAVASVNDRVSHQRSFFPFTFCAYYLFIKLHSQWAYQFMLHLKTSSPDNRKRDLQLKYEKYENRNKTQIPHPASNTASLPKKKLEKITRVPKILTRYTVATTQKTHITSTNVFSFTLESEIISVTVQTSWKMSPPSLNPHI